MYTNGTEWAMIRPPAQYQGTPGKNLDAQKAQNTKTIIHYHAIVNDYQTMAALRHLYALFSIAVIFPQSYLSGS